MANNWSDLASGKRIGEFTDDFLASLERQVKTNGGNYKIMCTVEIFLKTANRIVNDYGLTRLAGGTRKTFCRWVAAMLVAKKDDALVVELAKSKNYKDFMATFGSKKSAAAAKPAAKAKPAEESDEDDEDEEDGEEDGEEDDDEEEDEEEGGAAKVRNRTSTF